MYFDIKPIPEFPNYSVSVDGRVINNRTNRDMSFSPTTAGDLTVGLVKDGIQYRRSVKVLVAEAFVDGKSLYFDTPIQLDLDKHNLDSANIRWRPRWFAWRYNRQFSQDHPSWFFNGPIFDTVNEVQYSTVMEAAMTNGLLCNHIRLSLFNNDRVFPTTQIYTYI